MSGQALINKFSIYLLEFECINIFFTRVRNIQKQLKRLLYSTH